MEEQRIAQEGRTERREMTSVDYGKRGDGIVLADCAENAEYRTLTLYLDENGVKHVIEDDYTIVLHHDTEEDVEATIQFMRDRALWHPVKEWPPKDDSYLVTMKGSFIGCRKDFITVIAYKDGDWEEEEDAIIAWAKLPEVYKEGRDEQLMDKRLFISNFAETLRQTREDIVGLALSEDGNTVTILFDGGGTRKVSIACDSYVAIMRDILAAI